MAGDRDIQLATQQGNVNGDDAVNVIELQETKNNAFTALPTCG